MRSLNWWCECGVVSNIEAQEFQTLLEGGKINCYLSLGDNE